VAVRVRGRLAKALLDAVAAEAATCNPRSCIEIHPLTGVNYFFALTTTISPCNNNYFFILGSRGGSAFGNWPFATARTGKYFS
jgi:hypothetical protein